MTIDEPVRTSRWTISLRARIALLVSAAVAVAVGAAAVAAIFIASGKLHEQFDQDLLVRAQSAVAQSSINPRQLIVVSPAAGVTVGLLDATTGAIEGPRGGQAPPAGAAELAVARGQAAYSLTDATLDGQPVRVVAVPDPALNSAFVVAQVTTSIDHTIRVLTVVFSLVGLLGVVFAGIAGLLIARAALQPIDQLTTAAEEIARTEDLTPIPVRGDDELARLTSAFNAMLRALDQSRTRQRQLVGDAGHELRTPLTSLRTNLDLLAQNETTESIAQLRPDERAALLGDLRAQIAELGILVDDLVALSRDESTPASELLPVDLSEVVDRAVERVRRRGQGLQFDVIAQPWEILGDEPALERAVTNVLDNAAKWSPAGGTVTVRLKDGELTVADDGPGIAEADLPHVFERFYRSPEARATPGSGLGLAIVAQVVTRHGGTVAAERRGTHGTLIRLDFPGEVAAPVE